MAQHRSQKPEVVQLSLFSEAKEVDMWTCIISVAECAIWYYQGAMELMGLSGSISAGVTLDATTYSGGAAKYQWGYESCRPTGSDARATTTLTINGATTPFSDEVSNCPTVNTIRYTGSWDLGSDRTIWINMTSPWVGISINQSTIYIGHFVLDVNPIDRSALTTLPVIGWSSSTALTAVTSTSVSSVISLASNVSSTSLSVTSGNSLPPLQTLSIVPSASSVPETGGLAGTNLGEDSSKSAQGKLPGIIGGTVAGICVVIILILLFWRLRRNRKRELLGATVEPLHTEEFLGDNKEDVPYTIPSAPIFSPGHGILYSGSKNRPPSSAPPADSREALMGETQNSSIPSFSEDHRPAPGIPIRFIESEPNIPDSGLPPSPGTTVGSLPAYDTYMDAPLVTFRRAGRYTNAENRGEQS